MWTLTALLTLAQGAETEIVVYGDPFARWDDTRWDVAVELVVPTGTWLAEDANRGLTSYAFQVRSLLACRKDARLGKKRYEVRCTLEDVAIQATTYRHWGSPAAREVAQGVLDSLDAMLTGAELQLQVDATGGVNNVDIEGLDARNERERLARESLRQVAARLVSGFHVDLPDQAQRDGQFIERGGALMAMPSLTGSQGSTELVHTVTPWDERRLVQSVGRGLVSVSVPAPRTEAVHEVRDDSTANLPGDDLSRPDDSDTLGLIVLQGLDGYTRTIPGASPPSELGQPLPMQLDPTDGGVLEFPMTYDLTASAVGVFDPATGVMTERVWTVQGRPTASALGGAASSLPYQCIGRLRMLADGENPDLGPTRQVAMRGRDTGDLALFTALDTRSTP